MEKDYPARYTEDFRMNPEKRLCSPYDSYSIKEDEPIGKLTVPVQDNCAQENQK